MKVVKLIASSTLVLFFFYVPSQKNSKDSVEISEDIRLKNYKDSLIRSDSAILTLTIFHSKRYNDSLKASINRIDSSIKKAKQVIDSVIKDTTKKD